MDRTFVSRVTEDPANEAIVRSTVELSRALGLQVVAEGVEEEATSRAVAAMGCTLAQGYYFGRPMSVTDLVTARMVLPEDAVVGQLDGELLS
jgi:EAL domain-containing protein (putative c-di-GMP-specific phosphodiesterase class I)